MGIEAVEFLWFDCVGLDLADARNVVVEEGIESAAGFAGRLEAGFRLALVPADRKGHERKRSHREKRQPDMLREQITENDCELQEAADALVESFDDDAFHGRHVAGHPGHDVARGLIVEPAHGKTLDLSVQFAPEVMHDGLLEMIVGNRAEREEKLAEGNGPHAEQGERHNAFGLAPGNHFIREFLGEGRQHHHQQRAGDRQQQCSHGPPWVAPCPCKDSQQRRHLLAMPKTHGKCKGDCGRLRWPPRRCRGPRSLLKNPDW